MGGRGGGKGLLLNTERKRVWREGVEAKMGGSGRISRNPQRRMRLILSETPSLIGNGLHRRPGAGFRKAKSSGSRLVRREASEVEDAGGVRTGSLCRWRTR